MHTMARQRRNLPDTARGSKSRNSSTSNGSSTDQEIVSVKKSVFWHVRHLLLAAALGITLVLGVLGYLQTRVNTIFDEKRVVVRTGLDVPDRFWGTYRPGVYFGLKTRDPQSLVTGLMWYFPKRLGPGAAGIRHWCEQSDNLAKYGWIQHDGTNFGVQEIYDIPFKLTTSFVKKAGGHHGGEWTARIAVEVLPEYSMLVGADEEVSLIWYAALDAETRGSIVPSDSVTIRDDVAEQVTGINGETSSLGKFKMTVIPQKGKVSHKSFLSTIAPGLDLLKETVIQSLRLAPADQKGSRNIVLAGQLFPPETQNFQKKPNFVATQLTARLPFTIDVVFESKSVVNRDANRLTGDTYDNLLKWHRSRFLEQMQHIFHLQDVGLSSNETRCAEAALSNMVGGIGYFYGSSLVQSAYTEDPVSYWKAPLYTAVPSRSFFPRGFLWDEGFHGLLIAQWDIDIELDIMAHWFDLMNVEGWIPREQILGVEALAKVPKEFVVQRNTNANPPTFFLTLQFILTKYEQDFTNERLGLLERLYPRLQAWYQWFNTTQRGLVPGSYRWRGRDKFTNKELNPKTLTSGLDDYPRASHPDENERHIDLYCWLALASRVMARLANILGKDSYTKYKQTATYMYNNELLNSLHWSDTAGRYADYGLHTDDVKLVRPDPVPRQPNQNMDMVREVFKPPEYRLVDSTFGYVSLFPFFLHLIDPSSPQLGKILKDLEDPLLLWTNYGLRSLSTTSPLYMKRNTEHDPPYWRGQIWINMNYLAARALWYYGHVDGPYSKVADRIYGNLKGNIVRNVVRQYLETGYMWEQYNDKTGEGSGCRPFTGWTALVVILMNDGFDLDTNPL